MAFYTNWGVGDIFELSRMCPICVECLCIVYFSYCLLHVAALKLSRKVAISVNFQVDKNSNSPSLKKMFIKILSS